MAQNDIEMKERQLDFNRQDKPAIVEDSNGELITELKKQYKEIQQNLGLAITMLEKGQLTEGMKENILSLTDHNVNRFLTRMGYEGVLAEKQKKLTEQIRSLNDENRKLRHQLGEKVSNEDVRERLKIMVSSFRNWWTEYGFGHVSDFYFGEYVAKISLSGMVFASRVSKAGEEKKEEYLSRLGFEIEDRMVIYNDKSIALLNKLLTDKYPSIDIYSINLTTSALNGVPVIQDVVVFLRDLDNLTETASPIN